MEEQRETIAFLSDGASYGRPGASVERIDTHVSVVFLVGDRVYKLKRAVVFSYVDYATPERRERCCRAELALNRRTAPELYLGVRAITRDAEGRLGFDGLGTVVDWVVEMRRFDEAGLFDRLAEAGRLDAALMRDLADAIAAFHAAAARRDDLGGSAGIAAVVDGNHTNLRLAGEVLDQHQAGALYAASRGAVARLAPLLDRRRAEGRVRHCHGDLHLRNICLLDGHPTLFDCIEFSDAVAVIDVLYDLAFLLMDLEHRRLRPLANLVLNRYLDRTGDAGGLAALPLFLSARGAIRAHVSAAAAVHQPTGASGRRFAQDARAYLGLAVALLRPAQPRFIAVGGRSGTGKSTLAAALAPDFAPAPGARIIRSDTLRKRLLGVAPETRLPATAYDRQTSRRVYDALLTEAATAVAAGYTVILDAAFLDAAERRDAAAVATRTSVPFLGLWLEAPADLLAARIERRRGDASDADATVLRQQLTYDLGPLDWAPVDAGGGPAATAAAARAVVARTG